MLRLFRAGAIAAAGFLSLSAAHAFCGFYAGKADANLFNEASQVVIVRDGPRTVLSMLNDYKGPLNEFALVVPTPTTLQKGQVRIAERIVFDRLDAFSAPRLAEYHDADPCRVDFHWGYEQPVYRQSVPAPVAMMRPEVQKSRDAALGVTVEVQYTLEEYDIVSLSATQSDGLETWLRENGYRIPQGASAALRPYINQGMKFFVAKVNLQEQAKTGYTTLRPLQFAFESDKFMLPMRLGMLNAPPDKPQELIVYLLTRDGRVESSNYRTVKLPANVNLPAFMKPKFQDFYKAMFGRQAQLEEHRVVFTEYFWNMGWCDPCAANPLSTDELRKAGAFWVGGGNAQDNFRAMTQGRPSKGVAAADGGGQPVLITRLHLRYTAASFPEDLMFTQTRDQQNWQTRYVIQNPYGGSVAQCSAQVGTMDCEAMCKPRVDAVQRMRKDYLPQNLREMDAYSLGRDCVAACRASKEGGLSKAAQYYERDLPERIAKEKVTLAQLTGWSMADIDALPGARKYPAGPEPDTRTWWQKLFGSQP